MKWRSISSVTSKSAITPSFSGRIAEIVPGRAAEHALGLDPDGVDLAVRESIATTDGSDSTMPLPRT